MNDKMNEFNDFTNQTKAILEKIEIKKPIKKLKIFKIGVIISGFLALTISTALYILGFKASVYMVAGLVLSVILGAFFPILSVFKKERVCMLTYFVCIGISTVLTFVTSFFLNYYSHILSAVSHRKVSSGLFLNLGWPYIPLAFLMLLVSVIVYFCFKNKICGYSYESDKTEND